MFRSFSRLINTIVYVWRFMLKNEDLLILALLSAIFSGLWVAVSFEYLLPGFLVALEHVDGTNWPHVVAVPLLFFIILHFLYLFFSATIIHVAKERISGQKISIFEGINHMYARIPGLIGWMLMSLLVGFLLSLLESHSRTRRIVASVLQVSWSMISLMVLPIMVCEGVGPIKAIKNSMSLIKNTWRIWLGPGIIFLVLFALVGFVVVGLSYLWLFFFAPQADLGLLFEHISTLLSPGTWAAILVALLLVMYLFSMMYKSVFGAYVYLALKNPTLLKDKDHVLIERAMGK